MTVYQHFWTGKAGASTTSEPLSWTTRHSEHFRSFAEEGDSTLREVRPVQPVYVIPQDAISDMQTWSKSRAGLAKSAINKSI